MLKKIINHIVSFILTICLFCLLSLWIVSNTILNKEYILKQLNLNNYYQEVYDNIVDNFENNIISTGLEKSVAKELISIDKVKEDINNVIVGLYENKEITIDTQEIQVALEQEINKVLNNRVASSEEQENIKTLENEITKIYEEEIVYSLNIVQSLSGIYQKINVLVKIMLITLIVLSLIIIILTAIFSNKFKQTIGLSFLSSSITSILIYLIVGKKYQDILILNAIFSKLIINVISNILNLFLRYAIIFGIIGFILIILEIYRKISNKSELGE